MAGWRVRLRGTVLASVLGLVGGVLVISGQQPAKANAVSINLDYQCTGGIAAFGDRTVNLHTTLTIPTVLKVGDPLAVSWKLAYKDQSRFGSPARLPEGATVSVQGNVQLREGWVGVLQPTGSTRQTEPLIKGTPLTLPEGMSHSAHTTEEGRVVLEPGDIFVDFIPPSGELIINDDDPAIKYHGPWENHDGEPPSDGNHAHDIHVSHTAGDTATLTFHGTGIEYIGQRDREAGPVSIRLNGVPGTPPRIDPSQEADGTPTNYTRLGGQTLWSFRGLGYGKHTIRIKNLEGKRTTLDAFRVFTEELSTPPEEYRATCTLVSKPTSVEVIIGGPGPSGDPTDSGSPTGSPTTPGPDPTDSGSGSPGPSVTPTNTNSGSGNGNGSTPSSTPTPTPTPTRTTTATVTPTPTRTSTVTATATAQVRITPSGAAQTGEAPASPSGAVLIGAGGLMLAGSVLGGVAVRRRAAAHAGGRGDSRRD